MKRTFFAAAALFAGLLAFAAPASGELSLETVAELLSKNKVTRGQFVLERTAANGRSLKSSGDFTIASDYGIIWKTSKPIKAAQVVAKDFIVAETAAGKRVKTDSSNNAVYKQMALLTSALWNGDLASAQSAAQIEFFADAASWRIEMLPKDAAVQMALEKIVVEGTCSGGQAAATKMQMFLKGGNSATYLMSSQTFSASLTAAERAYFD